MSKTTDFKVFKAKAGLGLMANRNFKKAETVIEYTGEKITDSEADRRANRYLFELNDKWTIDGSGRKNTARYINHSCQPNCEAELDENEKHIYIKAKRAINVGEELTYHYGKTHFDEYIKPKGCRCNKCSAKKL